MGRNVGPAGAAFDHVLGLQALPTATSAALLPGGGPGALHRLPNLLHPSGVFKAVPDGEDKQRENEELAEAEAEHR
jgi:hypothetical protein